MDNKQKATIIANAMLKKANYDTGLGVKIIEANEGYCKLSMQITDRMLNSHSTCQGGVIFSFADCAFAYACNSRNDIAVAYSVDITFINPVYSGDVLTASAKERHLRGRSGVYEVEVINHQDEVVALFYGKSRSLQGKVVSEEELGEKS